MTEQIPMTYDKEVFVAQCSVTTTECSVIQNIRDKVKILDLTCGINIQGVPKLPDSSPG